MKFRLVLSHLGSQTQNHFGGYPTFADAYDAIISLTNRDCLVPGDTAGIEEDGVVVTTYIIQENHTVVNSIYYEI